jgi:hypothetical protein
VRLGTVHGYSEPLFGAFYCDAPPPLMALPMSIKGANRPVKSPRDRPTKLAVRLSTQASCVPSLASSMLHWAVMFGCLCLFGECDTIVFSVLVRAFLTVPNCRTSCDV